MVNARQNWAGSLPLPVVWQLKSHAIASSDKDLQSDCVHVS